jgi:hypothetical protein
VRSADERFAALQARLPQQPTTIVAFPSTDFGPEFARRQDVPALETRWLFALLALRDPSARVALVTSMPVAPQAVELHLGLLPDPDDARQRLALVALDDAGPQPLAAKLLDRPDAIAAVRAFVGAEPAATWPFSALSIADRDAALALDVPVWGVDHRFAHHATKSGSRRLLRAAGVAVPDGAEDVRTAGDVAAALAVLGRGAVVKLDDGVTGSGNAILRPGGALPDAHLAALAAGGVVEELVDAVASPSVQVAIGADGEVRVLSTHDQLLGGPLGHTYQGCRFPAGGPWASDLADIGLRVGVALAADGAVGRLAVDTVVDRDGRVLAVEVNPRAGATTHPHATLALLDAGATALRASDSVWLPEPRGADQVVAALRSEGLLLQRGEPAGVLPHLLDAVGRSGRLGLVALGRSPGEADELFERARLVAGSRDE